MDDFDMGDSCGQALPIGDDDGKSEFPTNGEEYLARVVKESKSCPKVMVAELPSHLRQKPKKPNYVDVSLSAQSACSLKPSISWQQMQINQFSKIREAFFQEKKTYNSSNPNLPDQEDEDAWIAFITENQALKQYILPLEQSALIDVLGYASMLIAESDAYDHNVGSWIYALLVALEKPLDPDLHSILREVARRCIALRTECGSEESTALHGMNLLICLIGRYFDQLDLAD